MGIVFPEAVLFRQILRTAFQKSALLEIFMLKKAVFYRRPLSGTTLCLPSSTMFSRSILLLSTCSNSATSPFSLKILKVQTLTVTLESLRTRQFFLAAPKLTMMMMTDSSEFMTRRSECEKVPWWWLTAQSVRKSCHDDWQLRVLEWAAMMIDSSECVRHGMKHTIFVTRANEWSVITGFF